MAIEIVDFPIKNGDFPLQTVSSPEGNITINKPPLKKPIEQSRKITMNLPFKSQQNSIKSQF